MHTKYSYYTTQLKEVGHKANKYMDNTHVFAFIYQSKINILEIHKNIIIVC